MLSLVKGSTVFINLLGGFARSVYVGWLLWLIYYCSCNVWFIPPPQQALLTRLKKIIILFSAYDIAQSKQHKSISASDVLKALETIEFSDMVNKLQAELLSASSTPNLIVLHSTIEHNLFFRLLNSLSRVMQE